MVIFVSMILTEIQPGSFIPVFIRDLDYRLFAKMNGEWHNSFFDNFFPFIRESYFWLPFYFFLSLFVLLNFKTRGLLWILIFIAMVIGTDYISSDLIKGNFPRIRPCSDPLLQNTIRFLVNYCPQSSSFTSSHAFNHFAAAMFIFTTFKNSISKKWVFIFLWAFMISYAQVYVGVHFPFDVFCGALFGLVPGWLTGMLFNKKVGLLPG